MDKVAKKKILILGGLSLFLLVMIVLVSVLPKRLVLRQRATGTGQVQVFFRAEGGESMAVNSTQKISIKIKNTGANAVTFYTFDTGVGFETNHFTIAPSSVRCLNMETVRRGVGVGSTATTVGSLELTCAQTAGMTLAAGDNKKVGEFTIQATAVGTSPLSFISPTIPDGSGGNLADAGASKTITITGPVTPSPTPGLVCVDGCYQARPESLVICNNNCQSKTGHDCMLIEQVGLCDWAPAYRCCYRGPTVTPGGPTNTPRPTATPGGPTNTPTPTVTPGGPTLTPTVTPTVTPPAGGWPVLNFKVKFQGVASKSADQKVRIVVKKAGLDKTFNNVNVVASDNGIYSGSVTLTDVPAADNYRISIKGPKHLSRKFCENNQAVRCVGTGRIALAGGANTLDFSKIVLEAGDLPNPNEGAKQDGVANSIDYSLWKARIGKEDNDSLAVADINFDGVVNQIDWQLMRVTLETKYEEEE